MIMIGANLGTLFLPWKTKSRDLQFTTYDSQAKGFNTLLGEEGMKELKKYICKNDAHFTKCHPSQKDKKELFEILESSRINFKENFFTYNTKKIDQKLKENNYRVLGFDGMCGFTVK